MSLIRWFTKNWANTTEPTHPDLRPIVHPGNTAETVVVVESAVHGLKLWTVESADPAAGTVHLVRRTPVAGFRDDIRLTLTPANGNGGDGGTRIDAESRSRVGIGDLGQNRRNILELWAALNLGT